MHDDVKCPYCFAGQEICHDDGAGYAEDETHQQDCWACGKTFGFTTSISYHYEAKIAPCMNGEPHDLVKSAVYPDIFKNPCHCKYCDFKDRSIDEAKRVAYFENLTGKPATPPNTHTGKGEG